VEIQLGVEIEIHTSVISHTLFSIGNPPNKPFLTSGMEITYLDLFASISNFIFQKISVMISAFVYLYNAYLPSYTSSQMIKTYLTIATLICFCNIVFAQDITIEKTRPSMLDKGNKDNLHAPGIMSLQKLMDIFWTSKINCSLKEKSGKYILKYYKDFANVKPPHMIVQESGKKKKTVRIFLGESTNVEEIFTIRVIQKYLENGTKPSYLGALFHPHRQIMETEKSQLKDKILLINKQDISSKLDIQKIKEYYPYPLEIVNYHKIEEVLVAKDKRYAYIQTVPYKFSASSDFRGVTTYFNKDFYSYIVNVENGKLIGHSPLSKNKISSKSLTSYAEFAEGN